MISIAENTVHLEKCYFIDLKNLLVYTSMWTICLMCVVWRLQLGLVAAVRLPELPEGEAARHDDQGAQGLPYWRMVRGIGICREIRHISVGAGGGADRSRFEGLAPASAPA